MKDLKLKNEELKLIIECLLFACTINVSMNTTEEHDLKLYELSSKLSHLLDKDDNFLENISYYDDPNERDQPYLKNILKNFNMPEDKL